MVKQINVAFDDEEYEKLRKAKGKKSWHNFIMSLVKEVEK